MRESSVVILLVVLATLGSVGCSPPTGAADDTPMFVDVTEQVGIDFHHFNGMSGEFYFCEIVGAGSALFDYDGDGDLDVYLIQGNVLGREAGKTVADARFPPRPEHGPPFRDRLYRNDLIETGKLGFTDVTAASGLRAEGYGMGIATGDYDRDGDVDLYLSNYDENQFWRNNGDGTFTDVTAQTGTGERRWSSSSAFFDYDGDGWLDLYVCNYVNYSTRSIKKCFDTSSARDYCGPKSFKPYPDRLFRNQGDGTFEDVTGISGVASAFGSGLGVVAADFDGDGRLDIYVANDGDENQLWRNNGDGTFKNIARRAAVGFNSNGHAEASMGVDAADFDGDGDFDLFMTHLLDETNTLYQNNGKARFLDLTNRSRLGTPSRGHTGFGAGALDYDNDGWLDILVVNGEVRTLHDLVKKGDPFPLHQPNQLYRNTGKAVFEEVTARAGDVFRLSAVSRGASFGDLDNDGDIDVLVTNNNGPPRLLLNETGNRNAWIGLRVRDEEDRYDLLGAKVEVRTSNGRVLWRRVRTDASYCSANDPRVLVGLGSAAITSIRVHHPGGLVEVWTGLAPRQWHVLRRGEGKCEER